MKISQNLNLAILVQLVFIGILISGLIYFTVSLKNESESRFKYASEIIEINDLTIDVKDFVNNRISYKELKKIFTDVSMNISNEQTLHKVNEMLMMNKEMHNLRTKNKGLRNKLMNFYDLSLQQSNNYLEIISQRLVNRYEREKVSVIERLVIGGATKNMNYIHGLPLNFLKMKEDITVKDELIAFLEDFNTHTLKDIENLKNTDFEDF